LDIPGLDPRRRKSKVLDSRSQLLQRVIGSYVIMTTAKTNAENNTEEAKELRHGLMRESALDGFGDGAGVIGHGIPCWSPCVHKFANSPGG
jgi:hypothetical protein